MYIDPKTVVSPKSRWKLGNVLCDTGQGGWSAATGTWDDGAVVAIRWNGDDEGTSGNPQSHGNPTWFIVPAELEDAVRAVAERLDRAKDFVKVEFSQPEGFEFGVWKVEAEVLPPFVARLEKWSTPLAFALPDLPKRLFRPFGETMEYLIPPTRHREPWSGRLVGGKWQAILQTNGIFEEQNPITIEVLRACLKASIVHALSALPN